jgi:hypothetical protein
MSPLTIVIAILAIVLIFMLLNYMVTDPYTLQEIQDGKTASTIEASELPTNGTDVPSSNFAYSVWFYVNNWNYRYGKPKIIFGRMGTKSEEGTGSVPGVNGKNPCPLVVLGAVENNIAISISCFPGAEDLPKDSNEKTITHTCSVTNIPIQRWVNLSMSVYGRTLDIYIDGKLVRTCLLPGIANVNNNSNIQVTPLGGFEGWTAKLQYYPNSINPQEAWNIYSKGYSSWGNMFKSYDVEISLMENGVAQNTITI